VERTESSVMRMFFVRRRRRDAQNLTVSQLILRRLDDHQQPSPSLLKEGFDVTLELAAFL